MTDLICRPCIGLGCDNVPDLASGINNAIYSALDYSFVVQCPPLCYCPPGLFPQTISILASTIPPVIPPILEPGAPIVLRLQGCTSLITRTLNPGSTQDQIIAAAQSMQAEWAGQQAICNAMQVPGVNCTSHQFITICNDPNSFFCATTGGTVIIPACAFTQQLNVFGLTQTQIDAATAIIKANLNQQATDSFCPFFGVACSINETNGGAGGGINIFVQNVATLTSFDSSTLQCCKLDGTSCFNSVQPTVAPLSTVECISFLGPQSILPFIIKYKGVTIFTDPNNNAGFDRNVTIGVNCGKP